MKNIATIGAKLSLNTAGFTSGLRSARHAMEGISKTQGQSGGGMFSGFAGTIAKVTIMALALRRVMGTVFGQFGELDEARKFALSIGQTGDYATERLLGLQNAMAKTGVTESEFRNGMRKMTKSIGEAGAGFGEGRKALETLGLSYEDLAKLNPSEQFLKIAEASQKLGGADKTVAIASKLFSESGIKMANAMRLPREEIEALIAEYERLGGKLTELDIARVEAMNDAVTDIRTAWNGVIKTLLANLAPALTAIFKIASEIMALVREKITKAFETSTEFAKMFWNELNNSGVMIYNIIMLVGDLVANLVKTVDMAFSLLITTWELADAWLGVDAGIKGADSSGAKFVNNAILGLRTVISGFKSLVEIVKASVRIVGNVIAQIILGITEMVTGALGKAFDAIAKGLVGALSWVGKKLQDVVNRDLVGHAPEWLSGPIKEMADTLANVNVGDLPESPFTKWTKDIGYIRSALTEIGQEDVAKIKDEYNSILDIYDKLRNNLNDPNGAAQGFAERIKALIDRIRNFKLPDTQKPDFQQPAFMGTVPDNKALIFGTAEEVKRRTGNTSEAYLKRIADATEAQNEYLRQRDAEEVSYNEYETINLELRPA